MTGEPSVWWMRHSLTGSRLRQGRQGSEQCTQPRVPSDWKGESTQYLQVVWRWRKLRLSRFFTSGTIQQQSLQMVQMGHHHISILHLHRSNSAQGQAQVTVSQATNPPAWDISPHIHLQKT